MRTVILALVIALGSSCNAAAKPLTDSYTHNTPPAVSEPSYKLAATWFLPDWQAGIASRTDTAPSDSGDRQNLTCSDYSLLSSIPANATCQKSSNPVPGRSLTCYSLCSCKPGFIPSPSGIANGCVADCPGYTLGTPDCKKGQSTEYCAGDNRYFRCTGTACPNESACTENQHCVQTAETIQSGCGSYCTQCENCPEGISCGNAKCAAYTTTSGCKDVCNKCCPASVGDCDNGCKTYSKETGCTDVCIECKAKTCDKPSGDCWNLSNGGNSSTDIPTSTTPSTTTPTTSTATPVSELCAPSGSFTYQETKTENYSDDCGNTYTRICYVPKTGYGWNQVNAGDILYFSPDALTVTPVIPTGGILQTDTTGSTSAKYSLTLQYFKSCEKYYRRDCKLYESSDGFSVSEGSVWNTGSQTATPTPPTTTPTTTTSTAAPSTTTSTAAPSTTTSTTTTAPSTTTSTSSPSTSTDIATPEITTSCMPTTSNTYGYENPFTQITDQRDSGCGWKYSRCCYEPKDGAGWSEIAYTGTTSVPSAIPSAQPTTCSSVISGEYMSWENNQPINCSGTISFTTGCDGTVYFKCSYDGSATTSIDVSTMPIVISGRTMKPIKTVGERGLTTVTQTLSSCGKSYQRSCKVPTGDGTYYILNAGMSSTNMITSCGINYGKNATTTCTTAAFPACSGGTGFQLQAENSCLSYDSCSTTTTPTDPSGTGGTSTSNCVPSSKLKMGNYSSTFEGWFAYKPSCYAYGTGKDKRLISGRDCDGNLYYGCLVKEGSVQSSYGCYAALSDGLQLTSRETSECNIPCDVQYSTGSEGSIPSAYICDGAYLTIVPLTPTSSPWSPEQ